MSEKQSSQLDLIMEFFKANPKRDITHPEVVDWVVNEWHKRTGKVFRDPERYKEFAPKRIFAKNRKRNLSL